MTKQFLKKYIKNVILKEDDFGGDFGGYGYGGFDPGADRLYKAFVQPFVDVGMTALAGIENLSNETQRLAGTILSGLAASVIPFARGNYEEIDAAANERARQISAKYKDVFDRTDEALVSDDARLASFLWSPVRHLSALTAIKSPKAALGIIDVISGGNQYVRSFTDAVREKFRLNKEHYSLGENLLTEAQGSSIIKKVMSHPDIQKAVNKSDVVKSMKQDALNLVKSHVNNVYNKARELMTFDSVDDVARKTGKKIDLSSLEKMDDSERQKAEKAIVEQARDLVRNFFKDQLKKYEKSLGAANELKAVVQRGVSALESL